MIGPVLGGILLRYVGWESIFFVNVPIGIVGIWLTMVSIPADQPVRKQESFDYLGAALLLISLFGLLLALTEAPTWGWADWRTLSLLATFVVAGVLFVVCEMRVSSPMLRLSILRRAAFSYNLLAALVLFCAISFNLLLMPFYLQLVRGLDQQGTGFVLISLPVMMSLASPVSGRLSDRIGPRLLHDCGAGRCCMRHVGVKPGRWKLAFVSRNHLSDDYGPWHRPIPKPQQQHRNGQRAARSPRCRWRAASRGTDAGTDQRHRHRWRDLGFADDGDRWALIRPNHFCAA